MRWLCLIATALLGILASRAAGHPTFSTSAVIKISPDGSVSISVRHDALAFALNDTSSNVSDAPMYELLNGSDQTMTGAFAEARNRFSRLFMLTADGKRVETRIVSFPTVEAVRTWQRDFPDRRLPVKMDIDAAAQLPLNSRGLSFRFPEVLGEIIVTIDRPGREPETLPMRPGETSPVYDVALAGTDERAAAPARSIRTLEVLWRYAALGFTHIVPQGSDHTLFVLGLFLLVPRVKTVLWQITAFTIAHTLTLTLSSLHIIGMPSSIVEPTIAATIAFIGVENLLTTRVHPWRPAIAFAFGLVHGLGVATAFNEAGFPQGQLVPSLAAFTVGVEGGHLAVLAAAFLALGWSRDKPWYRRRVAIPLSVCIAAVGVFWIVQRVAG